MKKRNVYAGRFRGFWRQVRKHKKRMLSITVVAMMIVSIGVGMLVTIPEKVSASYANFSDCKLITIDHTKIDSNLTNFPVWVYNVSTDWQSLQPDGDDVEFWSYDNSTEYAYEWEVLVHGLM